MDNACREPLSQKPKVPLFELGFRLPRPVPREEMIFRGVKDKVWIQAEDGRVRANLG